MFRRRFYLGKRFIVFWIRYWSGSCRIYKTRTEFVIDPKKDKAPKLHWARREFKRKSIKRGRHFDRRVR